MAVRAPRTPEQNRAIVINGLRAAADQYDADQRQAYAAIGGNTTQSMNRTADQFGKQAIEARDLAMILEEGEDNGEALLALFGSDVNRDLTRAWGAVMDIIGLLEEPSFPAAMTFRIHEALRRQGFHPEASEEVPERGVYGGERSPGGETVEELTEAAVRSLTDEFPRIGNAHNKQKPGWQEARDVAFQNRNLEQPGIRFAGDSGWSAWVPPRGPEDYEQGNWEQGAILGGYGETFWSTAAEAGAHIDAMAKKEIETVVQLAGTCYAHYQGGEIINLTWSPTNSATPEATVWEGDEDLVVNDVDAPFWKAVQLYLAETGYTDPTITWTE